MGGENTNRRFLDRTKKLFDPARSPFRHAFKYRSPHKLADINEILIEETEVCESMPFDAYIKFEQRIPYFSKAEIVGRDRNLPNGYSTFLEIVFGSDKIVVFHSNSDVTAQLHTSSYFTQVCTTGGLKDKVTSETELGVILTHKGEDLYEITVSAGEISKTCSFNKFLSNGNCIVKPSLNYVTKMITG